MTKDELDVVIRGDMTRLIKAQALSARRGGCPIDLAQVIARQVLWLKAPSGSFQQWMEITEQSGRAFLEWYEWYSEIKPVHTVEAVDTEPVLELVT